MTNPPEPTSSAAPHFFPANQEGRSVRTVGADCSEEWMYRATELQADMLMRSKRYIDSKKLLDEILDARPFDMQSYSKRSECNEKLGIFHSALSDQLKARGYLINDIVSADKTVDRFTLHAIRKLPLSSRLSIEADFLVKLIAKNSKDVKIRDEFSLYCNQYKQCLENGQQIPINAIEICLLLGQRKLANQILDKSVHSDRITATQAQIARIHILESNARTLEARAEYVKLKGQIENLKKVNPSFSARHPLAVFDLPTATQIFEYSHR